MIILVVRIVEYLRQSNYFEFKIQLHVTETQIEKAFS